MYLHEYLIDAFDSNKHVRIVNNHVIVLNTGRLVLLSNTTESVEEETVTKLHDVGLVDASDFLWN